MKPIPMDDQGVGRNLQASINPPSVVDLKLEFTRVVCGSSSRPKAYISVK